LSFSVEDKTQNYVPEILTSILYRTVSKLSQIWHEKRNGQTGSVWPKISGRNGHPPL